MRSVALSSSGINIRPADMTESAADHRPFVERAHRVGQDVGTTGKQDGHCFARMDERPTARRGVVAGHYNDEVGLIGHSLDNRTERGIKRLNGLHFTEWVFAMGGHVRALGMDMHELIPLGQELVRSAQFLPEIRGCIGLPRGGDRRHATHAGNADV